MIQHSRLVELAIKGLEAEKARIEQELTQESEDATNSDKQSTSSGTTGTATAGTRGGR